LWKKWCKCMSDVPNFEFEDFLKKEKDRFCKYRCLYSDGENISVKVSPCETCVVDDFVREIRDAKVNVE
jgi:hypothetical protein